ncbi:MAG: BlaI/MecI/CopY family transcriptional regulator [Candidatus Limnocylindria bacterium]
MERPEQMNTDYLGPLERRVMTELWNHGQRTVGQTLESLNATSDRKLAYTTVMTVLVRLRDKGYATRRASGRSYVYQPAMNEASLTASVGRRELGRLVERYGAASLAQFAEDLTTSNTDLVARIRELGGNEGDAP